MQAPAALISLRNAYLLPLVACVQTYSILQNGGVFGNLDNSGRGCEGQLGLSHHRTPESSPVPIQWILDILYFYHLLTSFSKINVKKKFFLRKAHIPIPHSQSNVQSHHLSHDTIPNTMWVLKSTYRLVINSERLSLFSLYSGSLYYVTSIFFPVVVMKRENVANFHFRSS